MKFFESRIGPSVFETYYRHAAKALETVEHMERCVAAACEDGDTAEAIAATSNAELEADENVPSLAEVQVALQQCVKDRKVLDAQCEATGEGTEFTCTYSLDGDTPETEREAMIAADGASYVLIDIPEDCQQL